MRYFVMPLLAPIIVIHFGCFTPPGAVTDVGHAHLDAQLWPPPSPARFDALVERTLPDKPVLPDEMQLVRYRHEVSIAVDLYEMGPAIATFGPRMTAEITLLRWREPQADWHISPIRFPVHWSRIPGVGQLRITPR